MKYTIAIDINKNDDKSDDFIIKILNDIQYFFATNNYDVNDIDYNMDKTVYLIPVDLDLSNKSNIVEYKIK